MNSMIDRFRQLPTRMTRAAIAMLVLVVVLFGFDLVGPLSGIYRLAAIRGIGCALLLAAWCLEAPSAPRREVILRRIALLALCVVFTAVERTWLAAIVFVAMIVVATPLLASRSFWPSGIGRALVVVTALAALPQLDPSTWHSLEHVWATTSERIGLAPATPASMPGLVASGWFAVLLGAGFALALVPRKMTLALVVLAIVGTLVWIARTFGGAAVGRPFQEAVMAHWRLVIAVPLALAAIAAAISRQREGVPTPHAHRERPWRTALLAGVAAISTIGVFAPERVAIAKGTRVAILEGGGAEFDVPEYGRFGAFSQGMFGLLPGTLERAGLSTRRVPVESDVAAELAATDVFVVINTDRAWKTSELVAVERFVSDGGRLIVLGDHTDVFGLLDPTNRLLAPFGIAFRFDSAYPLEGQSFRESQRTALARIHWSFRGNYAPTTGIGGSLVVTKPAYPLVWSDGGFSDHGVRENVQGSFLGNYSLNAGEEVGSQVLVAGCDHGRGRVLVFGDTSLFQNAGLDYTFEHEVEPILEWLLAQPHGGTTKPWLGLGCAGLVLVFLLLRTGVDSAVVALVTATTACFVSDEFRAEAYPHPARTGDVVVVQQFAQRFGDYDTEGSFIGPLTASARRSGSSVKYLSDLDDATSFRDASALILLAPRLEIDRDTRRRILEFARDGGTLFLIAGGRDAAGLGSLLEEIGVRVENRLLMERAEVGDLDFVEPYPLVLPSAARVLAEIDGQPVIGFVPIEAGGAIVVGDTRFFSTRNMEGLYSFDANVIAFTQQLFDKFVVRRVASMATDSRNEVGHAEGN